MSLGDKAFMQETFERYLRIVASTGRDRVLQPPLRMTIALRSQKRMMKIFPSIMHCG
jgi:hypothetical protein